VHAGGVSAGGAGCTRDTVAGAHDTTSATIEFVMVERMSTIAPGGAMKVCAIRRKRKT
jgi:hypothetical protein